ncbi:MAG: nitrilase-related carbon-nitrogen hydrolase [Peptoniphilus sp.]|nr:nitrilase-related carbon-nitrogen hydrolase [Peptoniphilus sp.]MDY3119078.1 nitrilase-related carbon-nitrogen hydrolase [Peptoniphilus sp.]
MSCVQIDGRKARIAPFSYIEQWIHRAMKENPDVILLPEKWNCFSSPDTHFEQADENGDKTRTLLSRLAKTYGVNIVGGSIAEARKGKLYNTCHVFDRVGEEALVYDKVHLYQSGIERDYYAAGDRLGLVTLDGIPCGVAICYDMDFPEWIRCYALQGVDIMFASFAWPSRWLGHMELVLRSRAIENQWYVAAAGICKSDRSGHMRSGGTALVTPGGDLLASAKSEEGVYTAIFQKSVLDAARQWQHFLDDRRSDLYRRFGL